MLEQEDEDGNDKEIRTSLDNAAHTYMEFIPPWKEMNRSMEPVMDHFVSIGNVLVLDEEHMNEWLHQQDSLPGDSHAFSRERHSRLSQRGPVASNCKCFSRPNGLSDCCMTNTSSGHQSMAVEDSFPPPPWVDHNSDDVPQKHVESWSYSCPSEANRSQLDHGLHLPLDEPLSNPDESHFDLHKHQSRNHHSHRNHHHQHQYCSQLGSLQDLEQCDLRERVHKWLMSIDRIKPDFESIDEIT